jgi:hypothetical protein
VGIVLAALLATYFTHSRWIGVENFGFSRTEDRSSASMQSYAENTIFQNRITIAIRHLTLIDLYLFQKGSTNAVLQTNLKELRQGLAAVGEYGVSKEETERFWKNYRTFLTQGSLKEIDLSVRSLVEIETALLGAAYINLYRQDFSKEELKGLEASVGALNVYRANATDVESSETSKLQIAAALLLVQTELSKLSKQIP